MGRQIYHYKNLIGIIKMDSGDAKIFGKDVWKDSFEIHKRISYVPGRWPYGEFNGWRDYRFVMKLHGAGDRAKRDYLIERFELEPRKKAKGYSKGNRQRLA